jgi:hypothetical protein
MALFARDRSNKGIRAAHSNVGGNVLVATDTIRLC